MVIVITKNKKDLIMSITVCSRKADSRSILVKKYSNSEQEMPVAKISPDISQLTPIAQRIVEFFEGKYIGGYYNQHKIIVESKEGSQYELDVKQKGKELTDNIYKCYNLDPSKERAKCDYLIPILEPNVTIEKYFNNLSKSIVKLAGINGRLTFKKPNKTWYNNETLTIDITEEIFNYY